MPNIESQIQNSEKLTFIYGGWPSFHDAEVVELHFWRGQMKPGGWDNSNVLPVLTVKIHIFIENVNSQYTLATLRFEDVDDFKMEGFNYQNAMLGLPISIREGGTLANGEKLPSNFVVEFKQAFGMSASFCCFRIAVVDAVGCTEEGKVA